MSYIGTRPELAILERVGPFTGDGNTSSFTLSRPPGNAEALLVVEGGVVQQPNVSYEISGYNLNFIDSNGDPRAPANGVEIFGLFRGLDVSRKALGTAAARQIGTNSDDVPSITLADSRYANTAGDTFTGNVTVSGDLSVSGTVDGRDVASDGSKLDGIESGADVTDTSNVTSAGALMDSELTNESAVKNIDQGLTTTSSVTFNGLDVDNLGFDGNTISSTDTDGNIVLSPNGDGLVVEVVGGTEYPIVSQRDIGTDPNQIPLNSSLGESAYLDPVPLVKTATNATGSAPIYACRAWVNSDVFTIRGSGNISSIVDRGTTGQFIVNFTTNMPDDDYAVHVTSHRSGNAIASVDGDFLGVDAFHIFIANTSGKPGTNDEFSIAVFR